MFKLHSSLHVQARDHKVVYESTDIARITDSSAAEDVYSITLDIELPRKRIGLCAPPGLRYHLDPTVVSALRASRLTPKWVVPECCDAYILLCVP